MKVVTMSDNYAGTIGGSIFGAVSGFHFFIQGYVVPATTGNAASDFVLEALMKMGGTIILAVLGGLAGLASKDLYKYLKSKFNGKIK